MRWKFSTGTELAAEERVVSKLRVGSKFFLFEVREELFDEGFQKALAAAFDPRGQEPVSPALLAMVNLLQRYTGLGDRDAVETATNDRRWQAILGTLESGEAGFDRGYLAANDDIAALRNDGVTIRSRAWRGGTNGRFGKEHFQTCLDAGVIACPAGKTADISKSGLAIFDEADCSACPLKRYCTEARRRTVHIHENEALLLELRAAQATADGRLAYRGRTVVEHKLARIDAVQGSHARYNGVRKNELDLNRAAAICNLLEVSRLRAA